MSVDPFDLGSAIATYDHTSHLSDCRVLEVGEIAFFSSKFQQLSKDRSGDGGREVVEG
jgi:hypothetical protein